MLNGIISNSPRIVSVFKLIGCYIKHQNMIFYTFIIKICWENWNNHLIPNVPTYLFLIEKIGK